jgi:hypothetical protein
MSNQRVILNASDYDQEQIGLKFLKRLCHWQPLYTRKVIWLFSEV